MARKKVVDKEAIRIADAINNIILNNLDIENVSSMLETWRKVDVMNLMLNKIHAKIEGEVKKYMKKQHWGRYFDEQTKINVSLDRIEHTTIDKSKLKLILTDSQMVQITNFGTKEVLKIVSDEQRNKIKNRLNKLGCR